jgi:hypothetical protein
MKQMGIAFRIWALDHDDLFPFNVPLAKGGTFELCARAAEGLEKNPIPHLTVMSNELNSAKIFWCPADTSKSPAPDFRALTLANVTYQLFSGPSLNPDNKHQVLLRCPIHGYVAYCDGAFKRNGLEAKNSRGE